MASTNANFAKANSKKQPVAEIVGVVILISAIVSCALFFGL